MRLRQCPQKRKFETRGGALDFQRQGAVCGNSVIVFIRTNFLHVLRCGSFALTKIA